MKKNPHGCQVKPWTVYDAKVNLAALLNDPRKLRRDYDLFTKTWGESFKDLPSGTAVHKSPRVPDVSQANFSKYLSQTRDKFLRHRSQYIQNSDAELRRDLGNSGQLFSQLSTSVAQHAAKKHLKLNRENVAYERKKIQASTRQTLDNVPRMFLRPDFSLEDPNTFMSVVNFNSSAGSITSTHKAQSRRAIDKGVFHEMSSSKLLQEKLSHYLDLVEVAIVRQISARSDAFFDAMTSHDDLNDYLKRMSSSVHQLRMKIASTGDNISKKCLKVVGLHSKRRSKLLLLTKLQTMITIHQAQPSIQLLLSTSEYAGALDLIETTQEVLKQELAGLHCFRHLSSQLSEIENVIGHMMKEELSNCMQTDLHRPIKEGYPTNNPHHLTAIALGLLRRKKLIFLEEFREEVKLAIKAIIKETVMGAVIAAEEDLTEEELNSEQQDGSNDTKEKTETLAERMRLLEFNIWIKLLNDIFDNLDVFLRRIKSFLTVMVNVVSSSSPHSINENVPEVFQEQDGGPNSQAVNGDENNVDHENTYADCKSDESILVNGTVDNRTLSVEETIDSENVWDDMDQYEVKLMESVNINNGFQTRKRTISIHHKSHSKDSSVTRKVPNSDAPGCSGPEHQTTATAYEDSPVQDLQTNVNYDLLLTEEECDEFMQSFCENLLWAADFSHNRCVKVIMAENKNSSLEKLTSQQFLALAQAIERYLSETESIIFADEDNQSSGDAQYFTEYFTACYGNSTRCGAALRGILLSQASRFISRFHEERKNKLSLILDNETWKQAEVPAELSKMLQSLSIAKSPSLLNNFQNQPTSTTLTIDGTQYAVVGTVLMLLKMVSEYIKCTDDLPNSTADLVTRVAELLTLFNSHSYQLVLGAGALQLAGLKTITTKNLGLASRCLQLVLYLLPSIRHRFQEKLMQYCPPTANTKQHNSLKHFDHVMKDYKEHIAEIDNKLVNIMDSAIEANLSKWQVKAPTPSKEFRMICRQVSKLYEMIADLLPEDQISLILDKVNVCLKKRLQIKLQQFGVRNDGGPQYGLVMSDVAFYQGSLKNLKVFRHREINMDSIWSERQSSRQ